MDLRDTDSVRVRLRVLDAVRRKVPFDWYVFPLTDPQTTVASGPLAHVPPSLMPRLPALIRSRYLASPYHWSTVDGVATWSGEFEVATIGFRDRFGCWGFLDLWRAEPFGDTGFLASIADPVTAALRRCQAAAFRSAEPRPARSGPVVLLLSNDLEVLGQTPQTHAYLSVLIPPAQGRPPIPAGAYNVAAQLLANEAGVSDLPPWSRVHLSGGLWVTLRAARMGENIAVSIEDSSPAERADLFTRAFGLSARESELIALLAKGNDTKQVAAAMHLSEHTVQDHLKSVFAKTSVHNRKELLSLVGGTA